MIKFPHNSNLTFKILTQTRPPQRPNNFYGSDFAGPDISRFMNRSKGTTTINPISKGRTIQEGRLSKSGNGLPISVSEGP
jgi:hypothetical protein